MKLMTIAILLLTIIPSAICADFVASKVSKKYHYPTCKLAKLISKPNLVIFHSPVSALNEGYTPCTVCYPPKR